MDLPCLDRYLADETLIEGCIKKDKRAWDIFVERYSKIVFWAIRQRLRRFGYIFDEDDIEDIHQDVFVSLWEGDKLGHIKDKTKIAAWISMVAGNSAIDYFRRMKRQLPPNSISLYEKIYSNSEGKDVTLEDILPQKSAWSPQGAAFNDIYSIIEAEIEALNPKEKIVAKLNLLHRMKHREIAEALHMPIDTVSTTIARTKDKLKERLRRKDLEDY